MELKTTTYEKVINPDNQEEELVKTMTFETVRTKSRTKAKLEEMKSSLQAQITEIDSEIAQFSK
tara:strand:- start:92 stop:283 length:192 start_codon:yes stop_codon:yes gene_type:complete